MHSKGINKTKYISKMKAIHSFHKCMVGGEPWFKHTKRLNAHPFSIHSLHCPKKQLQFFHSDAVTGQNSQHLYQQIYKQNTAALSTTQSATKHSVNQYMSHCWAQKQTLHSPSCFNRTFHSPSSLSLQSTNAALKT